MLTINPVYAYARSYSAQKTNSIKKKSNAVPSFQHREERLLSQHSYSILENLFHELYKAKNELAEMKIYTKGYEVSHKYKNSLDVNMRKYNPDKDTLLRLNPTVNGTALQVHIDNFREDEFIRFMVQMKDIKDNNGNIHLKKRTLTEFRRNYNFAEGIDYDGNKIDAIIEKYLK